MRRLALGAAWLAAGLAGSFLTIVLRQAVLMPLLPGLLVSNLFAAAVLAAATRRWGWGVIVAAGWLVLAVLDYGVVTPLLNHLLAPLVPRPNPGTLQPPPRSAYLAAWILYFTSFGLIKGVLSAVLLRFFLGRRWLWIALFGAAGLVSALSAYWELVVPAPGAPGAGVFLLPPVAGALALALCWRWDTEPPPLRLPRVPRPPAAEPAPSGYAGWIEDLEESLDG